MLLSRCKGHALTNEQSIEAKLKDEEFRVGNDCISAANSKMIWNRKRIVKDNQDHKKIPP
eukprot:scaffold10274_cov88-Skeletonema_dohrnii-CCMP3373.AAC.7